MKGVSAMDKALFIFFSSNIIVMIIRLYKKTILAIFVISFFVVPNAAVLAADISSKKVIELANKSRAKAGLPALVENDKLSAAARDKASDMVKKDYFAHTSPSGTTPWDWLKKNGYKYKYAGENLAMNYDSAAAQHDAWMKSQSHRANILNANYQEIGIAVLKGKVAGNSTLLTVEFFGTAVSGAVNPMKKENTPIIEGEKVAVAEKNEPAAIPVSEPQADPDPAPAQLAEKDNITPAPPDIQVADETSTLAIINLAWLVAFAVFVFSAVAGPVAIAIKALKKSITAWKGKAEYSGNFVLVNVSQQEEILKNFWQNMNKAVP